MNHFMRKTSWILCSAIYFSSPLFAEPIVESRYSNWQPQLSAAQRNPLQQIVRDLTIPVKIATIGDAMQFVLLRSGFHLLEPANDIRSQHCYMQHPFLMLNAASKIFPYSTC